jgi:hypothetical protein
MIKNLINERYIQTAKYRNRRFEEYIRPFTLTFGTIRLTQDY